MENIYESDIQTVKDLALEISNWLETSEGQCKMRESQLVGYNMIQNIKNARNISYKNLLEQITI